MRRGRKGQEEMVGFAIIMLIVALIALILLVIVERKPVSFDESRELGNFLQSIASFTTSCETSPYFYSLKELVKACSAGERCGDGKEACKVLNETLVALLKEGFPAGGKVNSTYLLIVHNSTGLEQLLVLGTDQCTGTRKGAEYFYPANPGVITISIEGCYV